MTDEPTKSKLLATFIFDNLEKCKITAEKNELIRDFNKAHDDMLVTQVHFGKTLRDVIDKNKLSYADYNLKEKDALKSSKKGGPLKTTFQDASVIGPKQNLDPQIIRNDISKNAINLQQAEQGRIKINYTPSMVAGFWVAILRLFQMFVPEIEDFTDEESKDIGESCLPLFQKYLQYGFMEFFGPFITIVSIFGGKFKKAREIRDTKNKKELDAREAAKNAKEEKSPKDEKPREIDTKIKGSKEPNVN